MFPNLGDNVWEVISIPSPQFFEAKYEIIFWTSYTQHMNYMIQTLMNAQLPQDRMFKLNTSKGYWFMAYMEDGGMESKDNLIALL